MYASFEGEQCLYVWWILWLCGKPRCVVLWSVLMFPSLLKRDFSTSKLSCTKRGNTLIRISGLEVQLMIELPGSD